MRTARKPIALALLLPGWLAAAAAADPSEPAPPPNVVIVTLDTTRADRLGSYGWKPARTPNLDRVAKEGVRFERALSPAPITLPAHASIMTGLVPRRHGVRDNSGFRLGTRAPVLAERLQEAGYATAAFVSAVVLDRDTGIHRGFELYDDLVRVGERRAFDYKERAANQTTDALLDRLPRLKQPYFLWLHYFDPHAPYVPPEPHRSQSKEPYDGEIAFLDEQLGRVFGALPERTLLIVTADHGESLGEHGEEMHAVFIYQATLRVPLIVRGPGIPAGRTVATTVGLVDVAPTVLDLLGLPPLAGVDGRSLAPLLAGKKATAVDYELESFFPHFSYGWAPLRGLVAGDLKYIQAPRPELYDLAIDPAELRNVLAERRDEGRRVARKLAALVGDDAPRRPDLDPAEAERRRRLASLGYVSGGAGGDDDIDPKDGIGWIRDLDAARSATARSRPDDCLQAVDRLLARNPGNVPARLTRVRCLVMAGREREAVQTARQVTEIDERNDLAWFNLANALAAAGGGSGSPDAGVAYERTLELAPRFADGYLNYASWLVRRKQPARAHAVLMRARRHGVADPDIETEIGVLELLRNRPAAAREAFARALALHPCAPDVHQALGRLAEKERSLVEAIAHYERAVACAPDPELQFRIEQLRAAASQGGG